MMESQGYLPQENLSWSGECIGCIIMDIYSEIFDLSACNYWICFQNFQCSVKRKSVHESFGQKTFQKL